MPVKAPSASAIKNKYLLSEVIKHAKKEFNDENFEFLVTAQAWSRGMNG